jgi:purine catabolism regulator
MLTVTACLQLEALADARVVAGRAGLDRQVSMAHVVDVPDVRPWVVPHALLMMSGVSRPESPEGWRNLVQDLDRAGLAGLMIAVGPYIETAPPALREEADRLGFPVVELPWELPFIRVSEAVHQAIIEEQLKTLRRIEWLQAETTRAALSAQSLQDLTFHFSRFLERPVGIFDEHHAPIAGAALNDVAVRFLPIRAERSSLHYLGVADDPPIGDVEGRALEHMAVVAALYLLRQLVAARTEERLRRSFLSNLLRQGSLPSANQREQARLLGFDPDRRHVLLLVRGPDVNSLERVVRQAFSGVRVLTAVVGTHLVGLVSEADVRREAWSRELAGLVAQHPALAVMVSDPVTAAELPRLHDAMRRVGSAAPAGRVTRLADLLFPRALAELPPNLMEEFCALTWGRLQDAELRRTLTALVECHGHQGAAAAALGVHRNTLRNRLDQIEVVLRRPLTPELLWQLGVAHWWLALHTRTEDSAHRPDHLD